MKAHFDMEQYSPSWWAIRRGRPTASEFGKILSPGAADPSWTCLASNTDTCGVRHRSLDAARKCADAKNKRRSSWPLVPIESEPEIASAHSSYICRLIGDTFDSQYPRIDRAVNDAMREGTRREPESRRWYEFDRGAKVQQVGFCETDDGRFGCSPDGLVGDDGIVGFKNPTHEVHTSYLLNGTLPDDYIPQTYGELWVTGRKWFDFTSYCPDFPAFVVRVEPCGPFWDALTPVLEQFWSNYQAALGRIREAA